MKSQQNNIKQKTNTIYLTIFLVLFIGLFLGLYIYIYYKNQDQFKNENIKNNNSENGKIAFLFLTYSNLKRPDIWNRFFDAKNSDKFTIYNHSKEPEKVTDLLLKDKHIPEHIETCWGCFGSVEANILMMKEALKDQLNKKFILVSESCIPIVSFDTFYNELTKDDKSIINIHDNNNLERYDNIIEPAFLKKDFTKHSGQGLIFNRKHAQLLVDSLIIYKNKWKNVICVDEHYFGNILPILDNDFNLNYNNRKFTFDIWNKDYLKTKEEIIVNSESYALFNSISNKVIDEIRELNFFIIRKINEKTEIDINYLVNS